MATRRGTASPLLLKVMSCLGAVRIRETFIKGDKPGHLVSGQCYGSSGPIEINPAPEIVDTLVHEALHALHPKWSETTVKGQTTRLMNRLTEEQLRTIYEVYLAKIGRTG